MLQSRINKCITEFHKQDYVMKFSFTSQFIRVTYGHYLDGLDLLKKLGLSHWRVESPTDRAEIDQLESAVSCIEATIKAGQGYGTTGECDELRNACKRLQEALDKNDINNIPF